jgi:Ricin-type beta-trefoil lectin domain
MRSFRRIATAAAVASLLAGGTVAGLTLSSGTAKAEEVTRCEVYPGAGGKCTLDATEPTPGSLELTVTSDPTGEESAVTWSNTCTSSSGASATTTGSANGVATLYAPVTNGVSNPASCEVTATVQIDINSKTIDGFLILDDNPATSTAPTPTPTSTLPVGVTGIIKGYDNKCVDDTGNSSSIRTKIEIWTCSKGDKAQQWRYTAGELIHNGLCLDDKGNGGSGSKVILWTCNGSSGEQWNHVLNNTFQVKAHTFANCLDDPAYSKKNGTQLTLYTCHNTANQHWTIP